VNQPVSKSSLSARQICLVELCQQHPFCRLEQLRVQGGEPLFTPPPTIIQKLRMGGDNNRRLTVCRNQPIFSMISASVAPFLR
jgi:hypothetical protein